MLKILKKIWEKIEYAFLVLVFWILCLFGDDWLYD